MFYYSVTSSLSVSTDSSTAGASSTASDLHATVNNNNID
jgi:hypothetical protein